MKSRITILSMLLVSLLLFSCGGEEAGKAEESAPEQVQETPKKELDFHANKGIGPIKKVELSPTIDMDMAAKGEKVYKEKCAACHKEYERYIGPAPAGILERRSPEWVMNMILNPEVMVKEDPIAKELLAEYLSPMANQNLTETEARNILEYFRTLKETE